MAVVLINRNRWFLVAAGDGTPGAVHLRPTLADLPEVNRVTLLRLEFVGPQQLYVVADVDLSGDDIEQNSAVRPRNLEARVREPPAVVATTAGLSAPDEPSLRP